MQNIASLSLLFGALTFLPSVARCEVYAPIPVQTIAGTTTDQSQNLLSGETGFLDVVARLAQTFTVGESGELSGIAITLNASTPITLNLLQTSNGLPTSTILASAVAVPGNSLGTWTYYDFSNSHIQVHPNEILAFEPSTAVSGGEVLGIDLAYGGTDKYTRGELYDIHPETGAIDWRPFVDEFPGQGPIGGADATFVTYVTPHGLGPPVPEPSTWAMLLIGFAAVGFLRPISKRGR